MSGYSPLSKEPWMGLPPKVLPYGHNLPFSHECSNGHDTVEWRSKTRVDTCWVCETKVGSELIL